MTIPPYDATLTHPLTTDALLEDRVSALIGRACRRQLWFLFLDADEVQRPLLLPFCDPPIHPDNSLPILARVVAEAIESENAHSVIVVIERYADAAFTESDREWARAISDEFHAQSLVVRCFLVSHRRGVRWFAPDDYRFAVTG